MYVVRMFVCVYAYPAYVRGCVTVKTSEEKEWISEYTNCSVGCLLSSPLHLSFSPPPLSSPPLPPLSLSLYDLLSSLCLLWCAMCVLYVLCVLCVLVLCLMCVSFCENSTPPAVTN